MYGTLRRLYAAGALTSYVVASDEGPHRKYYGMRANLDDLSQEELEELTGGLEADLEDALADSGATPSEQFGSGPAGCCCRTRPATPGCRDG